jgi:hypothetical protein
VRWHDGHGNKQWSDQTFTARFENHSEIRSAGIERGRVFPEQTTGLSRPPGDTFLPPVGQRPTVWLGVRFRVETDDEAKPAAENDDALTSQNAAVTGVTGVLHPPSGGIKVFKPTRTPCHPCHDPRSSAESPSHPGARTATEHHSSGAREPDVEAPPHSRSSLPVYDKSPWGDGITVITDINAGQGVSAPEGGTTSRDSYDSYDTPPREVAQTPLTTCAVCGEPMRPVTPDQTTHPLCEPSPAAVPSSESLDGKGSTRPDESPRWEQLLDDSTETPPHCPGEQAS